jgi:hypothetical protein
VERNEIELPRETLEDYVGVYEMCSTDSAARKVR